MLKKYLTPLLVLLLASGPRVLAQTVLKAQAVAPVPAVAAADTPTTPAVPLRDGDTIEIRIANVPSDDVGQITGMYTLDESGMVNIPFIGLTKLSGFPPSKAEIELQNKFIAEGIYTNPTVLVNPAIGARLVTVSGAVRAPQRVVFTSDLTLMSAISAAGGASDFAGDLIRLTRGGKVLKYSKKKLYKDPSQDIPLQPGDQVEVVEAGPLGF